MCEFGTINLNDGIRINLHLKQQHNRGAGGKHLQQKFLIQFLNSRRNLFINLHRARASVFMYAYAGHKSK